MNFRPKLIGYTNQKNLNQIVLYRHLEARCLIKNQKLVWSKIIGVREQDLSVLIFWFGFSCRKVLPIILKHY